MHSFTESVDSFDYVWVENQKCLSIVIRFVVQYTFYICSISSYLGGIYTNIGLEIQPDKSIVPAL